MLASNQGGNEGPTAEQIERVAAKARVPKLCKCGNRPKLYAAAGEFRLKCGCGQTGDWAGHTLGALTAWDALTTSKTEGK